MALDEAMLDMVASGSLPALFRTYSWSEPTLSLGYFQRYQEALDEPRFRSVPIVRRPTGGGALWHDAFEVTYAIVVPDSHPLSRPSSRLYRGVHSAIVSTLQAMTVPAIRRADLPMLPSLGPKPLLCFLDQDDDDLLIDGHKVVGSAQRRRNGAVLQHGSIRLRRSVTTPELMGIEDLVSNPLGMDLKSLLGPTILNALGLEARELHLAEERLIDQIATCYEETRYRTTAWTQRR